MNIYNDFMNKIKKDKDISNKTFIIDIENNTKLNYKRYTFLDAYNLASNIRNLICEFHGKRIAIILPNSFEFISAYIGTLISDNFLVSLSPEIFKEYGEILLENYKIDIILTTKEFVNLISCKYIKKLNDNFYLLKSNKKLENDNITKYGRILSFTSGTTGKMKGVIINENNIEYVSLQYKKIYKLSEKSKILGILPFWHNYGMFACVASSIYSLSTLVIMKEWDYKKALRAISKFGITVFPGAPYMYQSIVKNYKNEYNLDSLEICDCGGEMLPLEYLYRFKKITKKAITEGYGLTETTSLTHFNIFKNQKKAGCIGKPLENIECSLRHPETKKETKKNIGILWIKGPAVAKYYYYNNKIIPTCENGWFNTKDLAWRDEKDNYYIIGRYNDIKNLNIKPFPREIEEYIYKIEEVEKASVIVEYNEKKHNFTYLISVVLNKKFPKYKLENFIIEKFDNINIKSINILSKFKLTYTRKIKK
ncbi:Acyl-CoA synthetase (AMP-forming)/AMP-acid ligase II [Marinitoga hydrogenitolerans DSM 16785]|uniref:Acyl-CoA synthetase (AMP-forming)/AMP-acid ligase II n=1 Tax=Marinitoga hydrogenitolerans (strain DSM 16785 / JCM 12826 / AT1271) TaxID=1122195 RepID=A0A1M4VDY6_MARH1|nr:AMP-binding protein [Marinitoga hydrogenitolerans]SHE67196.1 Acyl-CoA synthetase (AMP-forming)/AMP-acid ligase II [Marinitoga hydrogenitolerans DSM 16785]